MAVCPPVQPAPPPNPISQGKLSQEQKKCSKVGGAWGETRSRGGGGKRTGLGLKGGAEVGGREKVKGGFEDLEEGRGGNRMAGSWAPGLNGGWYQWGARGKHAPVASSLSEDVITPAKW